MGASSQLARPPRRAVRASTGCSTLDAALDGGLPSGALALVVGEPGAGAGELAHAMLRAAAGSHRPARCLSALRSPARVRREHEALFPDAPPLDVVDARGAPLPERLAPDELVVFESASALAPERGGAPQAAERLGEAAAEAGACVVLLHAPGTLPPGDEARLAERADAMLRLRWVTAGLVARRVLEVASVRGLAPLLEASQVPALEVTLERGVGLRAARVRSVA